MADTPTKACSACGQEKPLSEFHKNARMASGYRSSCKPCTLAINRKSVLMHHEKRKAEKRAVYLAQRDTPEYRAYVKAYQAATRDRKRAYDRERHKGQASEVAKRAAEWNRANRERRAAITRNYSCRRRVKVGVGVSTQALREWTAAQKKVCHWCGCKCPNSFHIDHYVPLSKGGAHELQNLVIACGPCNLRKNAKDPLDFAREVGRLL